VRSYNVCVAHSLCGCRARGRSHRGFRLAGSVPHKADGPPGVGMLNLPYEAQFKRMLT